MHRPQRSLDRRIVKCIVHAVMLSNTMLIYAIHCCIERIENDCLVGEPCLVAASKVRPKVAERDGGGEN